jgi:hypothetical protein
MNNTLTLYHKAAWTFWIKIGDLQACLYRVAFKSYKLQLALKYQVVWNSSLERVVGKGKHRFGI